MRIQSLAQFPAICLLLLGGFQPSVVLAQESGMFLQGETWAVKGDPATGGIVFAASGEKIELVPMSVGVMPEGIDTWAVSRSDEGTVVKAGIRFNSGVRELDILVTDYGTVSIALGEAVSAIRLVCPIEVGVLPAIRLEDVLFTPTGTHDSKEIYLGCENWFAALLSGRNAILTCAWPEAASMVSLGGHAGNESFPYVEIDTRTSPLYLELMSYPSIWHRQKLTLDLLEKEVATEWKRPLPVQFRTQVPLKGASMAMRTLYLPNGKQSSWKPEVGDFTWPVFFRDGQMMFYYSKKVPPLGEMITYPASGGAMTLEGFLDRIPLKGRIRQRNEGRAMPDVAVPPPNVGYNACWGTFMLRRTMYVEGHQQHFQRLLAEHADFIAGYTARVQLRNRAYFDFVDHMRGRFTVWRDGAGNDEEVMGYLREMDSYLDEVEKEHRSRLDRYGDQEPEAHAAHATRNAERIKELLCMPGNECYPELENLIDEINRLSWGHDEDTGMRFGMLTRHWAQEAALKAMDDPQKAAYARKIRAEIRGALNGAAGW